MSDRTRISPEHVQRKIVERDTIKRAKSGDRTAFEELYRKYSARVLRVCMSLVRDQSTAEDLLQETFLRAYRKLDTFREDSLFSTWLHRIAVNSVLMYLRSQSTLPPSVSVDAPTHTDGDGEETQLTIGTSDARLEASIERVALQRAIAQLPPGYRLVVVLHDIEGYQHEEIAEMLGCTMGNTKSQLHKARLKLRTLLRDDVREERALMGKQAA